MNTQMLILESHSSSALLSIQTDPCDYDNETITPKQNKNKKIANSLKSSISYS